MKKNIIALIAIALIATAGLFATDSKTLDLNTHISGINLMSLSSVQLTTSTVTAYNTALASPVSTATLNSSAASGTLAYLNILSNKRTGFTVTVTATHLAGTNGNPYTIDYSVTAGSASYDTSASTHTGNTLAPSANLTGLTAFSYAVSADLNDSQYAAALEDTYTGTVTFTYTAS
ncbi:hypothetical protein [uncultured Sphaerochaeta sp.]|uniref:hypothetical protein n=1 Tax=uncultured Sphaerochaeta sp. TaxID=886478 RepID=UPI002A0A16D9|nr:hypothetical protein [uncultured Sphaerochaeta sp.]